MTIAYQSENHSVVNPEIRGVFDVRSSEALDTEAYINSLKYREVIGLRTFIKDRLSTGQPCFKCIECDNPVTLVASPRKRFFFRHTLEDGRCSAKTRGRFSQGEIRALIYGRRKESPRHRKLKTQISQSLSADPDFRNIVEEQRIAGVCAENWRKPDLLADRGNERYAFEAQVNPTFLDVILARGDFYRTENIILSWILPSFDPHDRRLAIDDIWFNNRKTILVVDDETTSLSETSKKFFVRCWTFNADLEHPAWEHHTIPFNCLNFSANSIDVEIASPNEKSDPKILLEKLLGRRDETTQKERQKLWDDVREIFVDKGIELSGSYRCSSEFHALFLALKSLETGEVYGWSFQKLIQVAHHLKNGEPRVFPAFLACISAFRMNPIFEEQDRRRKFAEARDEFRRRWQEARDDFLLDPQEIAALSLLFPKAEGALVKFRRN